jgi:hypothetical protein
MPKTFQDAAARHRVLIEGRTSLALPCALTSLPQPAVANFRLRPAIKRFARTVQVNSDHSLPVQKFESIERAPKGQGAALNY